MLIAHYQASSAGKSPLSSEFNNNKPRVNKRQNQQHNGSLLSQENQQDWWQCLHRSLIRKRNRKMCRKNHRTQWNPCYNKKRTTFKRISEDSRMLCRFIKSTLPHGMIRRTRRYLRRCLVYTIHSRAVPNRESFRPNTNSCSELH